MNMAVVEERSITTFREDGGKLYFSSVFAPAD
jgi:hypothetical protein